MCGLDVDDDAVHRCPPATVAGVEHWRNCEGGACLPCDMERNGSNNVGIGCPGCRAACERHGENRLGYWFEHGEPIGPVQQILCPDCDTQVGEIAPNGDELTWCHSNRPCLDALKAKNRAGEMILRRMVWLSHGCDPIALYGDDGEMQCGQCCIDFKRLTPAEIQNARFWAGHARMLKQARENAERREEILAQINEDPRGDLQACALEEPGGVKDC